MVVVAGSVVVGSPSVVSAPVLSFPEPGGWQKPATAWQADEQPNALLNGAGVRFTQGLLADLTGDGLNDLVVVEETGALRIYPGQ